MNKAVLSKQTYLLKGGVESGYKAKLFAAADRLVCPPISEDWLFLDRVIDAPVYQAYTDLGKEIWQLKDFSGPVPLSASSQALF